MNTRDRKKAPQVWCTDSEELIDDLREFVKQDIPKFFYDSLRKLNKEKDFDKPLTYYEACDFLRVSKPTLSKWIDDGLIPYTSVDPENPKSRRYFQKKYLIEFSDRDWETQAS